MTVQSNVREYLLAAVPIREVPSGGKYVFPKDIPQPYQDQFLRDTAGQTCKTIDGELAYFDYDFMAWLNRSFSQIRMKHMGSSAADLAINFQINTANCVVSLQTDAFDSALIADFLGRVLLQRNGVVTIRDDRTRSRRTYRGWQRSHDGRATVPCRCNCRQSHRKTDPDHAPTSGQIIAVKAALRGLPPKTAEDKEA